MLSGVYFNSDEIIKYAQRTPPGAHGDASESLEEENRRMREELDELRRRRE